MTRAVDLVHDASIGMSGSLKVGYVCGYERSDLSVWIQRFHRDNPNILISFYRGTTDVLAAGLLGGEYDLVFTWDSTNLKQNPEVTYRTVEQVRLVVALYNRHPLA